MQLFGESDDIALDCFFVYPEELKSSRAYRFFATFWSRKRSSGISRAFQIATAIRVTYEHCTRIA